MYFSLIFTVLALFASLTSAFPASDATLSNSLVAANASISGISLYNQAGQTGCFGSGQVGDGKWINDHIIDICFQTFRGRYRKNWWGREACYNTQLSGRSPGSYWFAVYNMDEFQDRDLDLFQCSSYMRKISNDCPRGGDFAFWDIGWRMVLDPEGAISCSQH